MTRMLCGAGVLVLVLAAGDALGQDGPRRATFAGRWSGTWEDTRGRSGLDSLILEESPAGVLTGLHDGDGRLRGERVGPNTFTFEVRNDIKVFRVVGRVEGGRLVLEYAVTYVETGERYTGRSVLDRAD